MGQHPKSDSTQPSPVEQAILDEEVLRANRDLAAYFRGKRTEREARAALKIIRAFIRDRERLDTERRRPLPSVNRPGTARRRPTLDAIASTAARSANDGEPDLWRYRIPWVVNARPPKRSE